MRISDWSSDVCSSDLLAYVARIVADRHRLADIGGERRVEVSQPLETDAVAVDDARLGDHDQQRVQFLQRFRHPGQPAIAAPRIDGRYADRPVRADVIGRHDVCADRSVQFGKRQARSEEHTSELQSLMRISYAVFCLKNKK